MSETTSPVLRAQHLGVAFGGLQAVSDFNMEIAPASLWAS
jgi:branched-chain amino acid transport system ATP-binding protein